MLISKGLLEAPVLDALLAFTKSPEPDDAVRALSLASVASAAIDVAERVRALAREEDERRKVLKQSLINYRRFYVGGVGIGVTVTGSNRRPYQWWAFASANTKPSKLSCKFCAEMRIMKAAREVRCSCIGGMVVVGELQPDGRSGKQRMTLDPCGECRDMMRSGDYRYLFRQRTLVLTAQPLAQVWNLEPLTIMMKAHGESFP